MNQRFGYEELGPGLPERDDEDEFNFRLKASKISQKMQEFKRKVMSVRSAVENIGSSIDNIDFLTKLQIQHKEANDYAHEIGDLLKQLASMRSANPSDQRVRDTQLEKLSNSFSIALREFQNIQRSAALRERATVSAAKKHVEPTPLVSTDFPPHGRIEGFAQDQELIFDQHQESVSLDEIVQREGAIRKIEEDIIGVNDIMKDLAVMIHEQGQMIDSIESHVEVTHGLVQNANVELTKARDLQTKSRKRMFYIVLFLILACIILGFIIYMSSRNKSKPT